MTFVFGWYSFKLKSFTPKDLEINDDYWNNSTFEIRQKVFHIFWIPFFSIGKSYVEKKNGKKYDLPDNIISKIKQKTDVKTPWYSFLLLILALAIPLIVGIYIYIGESLLKHKNNKRDKELYNASITEIQKDLNEISLNAYVHITNTEKLNNKEDGINFLKLVNIKGNSYEFQPLKMHFPKYPNEKYYFEKINQNTSVIITKEELQKAICKDYDMFKKQLPFGVSFFKDGKYIITKIEYFDKPVITGEEDWRFWDIIRRTDFNYNRDFRENGTEITLNFQNFGESAELLEIKNKFNNIKWIDSLPIKFNKYQYLEEIPIKAIYNDQTNAIKFESVFVFKDSLNNKYKYIVEGDKNYYKVRKN